MGVEEGGRAVVTLTLRWRSRAANMMVLSKVQLSATEVKTLAVSSNAAMPDPLSSTPAVASHRSVVRAQWKRH